MVIAMERLPELFSRITWRKSTPWLYDQATSWIRKLIEVVSRWSARSSTCEDLVALSTTL